MNINNLINLRKWFFLVPILLAIIAFANSYNGGFIYDDTSIMGAAPALGDWSKENLKLVFSRDIWSFIQRDYSWQGQFRTSYYRPFFTLFLMFNYSYAGLNAIWWHITSIILHLLTIVLAYFLIRNSLIFLQPQISPQISTEKVSLISLIATTFFAIHPVQSESVAWIAAYGNALSTSLIFIALLCYLKTRQTSNKLYLLIALVSSLLAVLTKESVIFLPIIVCLYELILFGRPSFKEWKKLIPAFTLCLLFVAYLIFRIKLFGSIRLGTSDINYPELTTPTLSTLLLSLPQLCLKYLQILVWPFAIKPFYANGYINSTTLTDFYLPLFILIITALTLLIVAISEPIVRLSLIWIVVPMLPVLDVRSFKLEELIHDRYLYISVYGAGILFGWFIVQKLAQWTQVRLVLALCLFIFALFTSLTIQQNRIWTDEWNYWQASLEEYPNSCIASQELGRLFSEKDNNILAIDYYEQAKKTCPHSILLNYKLGLLYGKENNLPNASIAFQQMIQYSTNNIIRATGYFNLGLVYEKQGDISRALENYQLGLKWNPNSKNAAEIEQIIKDLQHRQQLEKGS